MSRITTRRKLSYEEPSSSSCSLCHGHHVHFSTPATWKSKEAQSYVLSLKITENDLICAACRKDIARVLNDSAYVPYFLVLPPSPDLPPTSFYRRGSKG